MSLLPMKPIAILLLAVVTVAGVVAATTVRAIRTLVIGPGQ